MCIDGFIVEPGTIARFPLQAAHHAEFSGAATGHVVATFFELDHCAATIAPLPAFLFRRLHESFRLWIFRAFSRGVHLLRTNRAHSSFALLTTTDLAAILHGDIVRFDPGSAFSSWTIYTILGLVFLKLAIPGHFEFVIEELFDVLEINVLIGATSRRHVCWVIDGHGENTLEA